MLARRSATFRLSGNRNYGDHAPSDHRRQWRAAYGLQPERDALFTTLAGEPVEPLYTEEDLPAPAGRSAAPATIPYTRGVYPSMYRGRLWTMRQFAGFGTAEETNERFRYLLDHGQTGPRTAFDMPTLMGYDSDHARSLGEVGREGVADRHARRHGDAVRRHRPRRGHRLDDDQRAGGDHARVLRRRGRGARACPPSGCAARSRPTSSRSTSPRRSGASRSTRRCACCGDMIEWCPREMPRWHPISISGYHIREAGSTAAQELAFTLKDGFTYVEQAIERGLDVDDFAPRLSFFFNAHIDFFEEIAKYRAARRIWARELRETLRREGPALAADALPHADGRRVADRAAAAEQHRPHGDRGARRRARRHAVAAHELLRRGARAADRGRRADRAAHAADHRPRDRRGEHDRPARRLVLRRGADRPARARGLRLLRAASTSSAAWSRRSSRTSRSARSPTPPSSCSPRSTTASGSSSASTATSTRRRRRSRSLRIDPALERKQIDRAAGRARAARRAPRSRRRSPRCARPPRARRAT